MSVPGGWWHPAYRHPVWGFGTIFGRIRHFLFITMVPIFWLTGLGRKAMKIESSGWWLYAPGPEIKHRKFLKHFR